MMDNFLFLLIIGKKMYIVLFQPSTGIFLLDSFPLYNQSYETDAWVLLDAVSHYIYRLYCTKIIHQSIQNKLHVGYEAY